MWDVSVIFKKLELYLTLIVILKKKNKNIIVNETSKIKM